MTGRTTTLKIQSGGGHQTTIGPHLFTQLGLSSNPSKLIQIVNHSQCPIKSQIALDFPFLISGIFRSCNYTVKSTFQRNFIPTNKNGRRVPINLQPLLNTEFRKVIDEKHIIKHNSRSNKNFISPIVIIVKQDKTAMLASELKI